MESANTSAKNQATVDLLAETASRREESKNPRPDINSSDSSETSLPKPLEDMPKEQTDQVAFACKYCSRTFTGRMALNGHQKAHRVEKALEKSAKVRARAGPHFPNKSFQSKPNRCFPYPIPGANNPPNMLQMDLHRYRPLPILNPGNNYPGGRAKLLMASPPINMQQHLAYACFPPPGIGGAGTTGGAVVATSEGPSLSLLGVGSCGNEELNLTLKL